jgi:hypothetical protein
MRRGTGETIGMETTDGAKSVNLLRELAWRLAEIRRTDCAGMCQESRGAFEAWDSEEELCIGAREARGFIDGTGTFLSID